MKHSSKGQKQATLKRQDNRVKEELDTVELCTACPYTSGLPANIDAFPSAIVSAKRSEIIDRAVCRSTATRLLTTLLHPVTCGRKQGKSLDSISSLRLIWPLGAIKALETFCRHAVRAGPFSLHPSWPIFHLSSISQAPFGVT